MRMPNRMDWSYIKLFVTFLVKVTFSQNSSLNWTDTHSEPLLLTSLITEGDLNRARLLSEVSYFRQYNITSYSGYFTVNQTYNSNLFFWFFPCTNRSDEAPLMLWLQGGPGHPSTLGLFVENGPFSLDDDLQLSLRKYSWTNMFNMLYIDNPVGTGFSFTDSPLGYATGQDDVVRDVYEALAQFFVLFSEFVSNEFYLAGESYAGKYISNLALKIHMENEKLPASPVNLRGIAVGGGFIDPLTMLDHGDFLFDLGLIDGRERTYFRSVQSDAIRLIREGLFEAALAIEDSLIFGFARRATKYAEVTGYGQYYNFLRTTSPYYFQYIEFLERPEVRNGIHVGNATLQPDDSVREKLASDLMRSAKSSFEAILDHGYRTLLYGGNLDIIVGLPMLLNFVEHLQWRFAENHTMVPRTFLRGDDSLVMAYLKRYENFYFAVVRNAGHLAIYDQPESCYRLMAYFVLDRDFSELIELL